MQPSSSHSQPILIVGGTGKTGRRIADRLARRGISHRIGTRSAAPAFDWDRPAGWARVLDGVGSAYIAYPPDLAVPAATAHIGAFAAAAVRAGVGHLVLLSGRGEDEVLASEAAVRSSGAAWTILRCGWFAQNFSEGLLLEPLRAGELAFPAGETAEPFVDLDDVADAAVAVLTDPVHRNQLYELTGPRLLTFGQAVAELAAAAACPMRYVPVSSAAYEQALQTVMPADDAAFLTGLFARILDGHNAHLSDGIQRILGRAPRDFADFARDAAAAGAWA